MERNVFLKIFLFILIAVIWSLMLPHSFSMAQPSFPARSAAIWVGFPACGSTDIIARILAEGAEKSFGQKIVVVNKPGGGGTVCASLIARQKPDGYTIAAFTDTPVARSPHMEDLDYDSFQDLSYIILVGLWKNAFVVKTDSPFNKWKDVVDWAKKNPGQLIYGHPGIGTTPHLAMVKVAKKEGFTFKSVPFAGAAPTVSALLGGHVMIAAGTTLAYRAHVQAKTLKLLLVFEKEGLDYAPNIPTFEKMHYDFELPTSVIICAPKGIPDHVRETWERTFIEGMNQEAFKKVAREQELLLMKPLTNKDLLDYIRKCSLLYEQSIKEAGVYKKEKR